MSSAVGTLAVMPTAPAPHVLVVDDEPIVRDVLTRYLTRAGYQVSDAGDGEQALEAISAGHPDVVLLDLMLPRVNGLDVLRTVRRDSDVPVIVLSARSSEGSGSTVCGKAPTTTSSSRTPPARWWPGWRRCCAAPARPGRRCTCGAATIDPAAREVRRDGQVVHTTRKEFELLHLLVRHPGQVFSRRQLLERVWEDSWAGATDTVTVHIRRLRAKVELEPSAPRHLVTVHGVGYRFDP